MENLGNLEHLSRQRLDFSTGPKGECVATLTITLQDGSVHIYSQSVDDAEVEAYGAAIAAAEARQARIEGIGEHEISGIFSSVGSAFKSVYRGAQKIASSKVFKYAGRGMLAAAPALGPLAPAAAAVGGGMVAASALSDASLAAEAKAKRIARKLTKAAKKTARAVSKKTGIRLGALLKYANKRRKGAKRRVGKRRKRKSRPSRLSRALSKAARRARKRRTKKGRRRIRKAPSPLRAAKRGTLRSNKPGGVTSRELKRAAKRGRIFWVA